MGKQRYWICIIGPVDGDKIPDGGDSPPRWAARTAQCNMTGVDPTCASGWIDESELVSEATRMARGTIKSEKRKHRPPPTKPEVMDSLPKWLDKYAKGGIIKSAMRNGHMNNVAY